MADIIQIRRGLASQWTSTNPVLADGELGFETDTKKGKLGNGVTAWNSLTYSFTGESINVAEQITAATSKTTPADADNFGITDSAASNVLKKLSWVNIKTALNSLYAAVSHVHSAADITSGILTAIRGGTGIGSYTANNYIRALNSTTLEQRTPAQVLSDIGAAASSHTHNASAITAGTLAVARGGTGIASYTTGNYIRASGATTLEQRTPTQVLSDLGAGYIGIPQVSQSANYTLILSDQGKHILHPSADTTARTFTIPANGTVDFPIGTAITFVNQNGGGVITIAITTDTMRLAGSGATGSRTLAANGIATAIKVTATEWLISGTNLT
jgi:hypothetical protein